MDRYDFQSECRESICNDFDEYSEEYLAAHLENNPGAIQYIRKPTKRLLKIAITEDPWCLGYVKEEYRTLEFCTIAVLKEPLTLQYVKRQTPEVCLIAIKANHFAYTFVNKDVLNSDIFKRQLIVEGLFI